MNSKQRVHAALRREPVDRLPVFMWFHPQTAQRLAGLLEIPVSRVAEAMGDDVRHDLGEQQLRHGRNRPRERRRIARGLLGRASGPSSTGSIKSPDFRSPGRVARRFFAINSPSTTWKN